MTGGINMEVKNLFKKIAFCKNIEQFNKKIYEIHPCFELLSQRFEKISDIDDFLISEPFNGDIKNSKIMYLSQNPALFEEIKFPTWKDAKNNFENVFSFFIERFQNNKSKLSYKVKLRNGNEKRVPLWNLIKNNTAILLKKKKKEIIDGNYFSIVDVVHCKSNSSSAVSKSLSMCASLYLKKILEISNCKLIVCMGKHAQRSLNWIYNIYQSGFYEVEGKKRWIVFASHHNKRGGEKQIEKVINNKKTFKEIQNFLTGQTTLV
jgi:uracil-DNA glycosylase